MRALRTETFLAPNSNPTTRAGVAEWLSRWPRDPKLHNGQASQWALARRGSNPFPGAIWVLEAEIILFENTYMFAKI